MGDRNPGVYNRIKKISEAGLHNAARRAREGIPHGPHPATLPLCRGVPNTVLGNQQKPETPSQGEMRKTVGRHTQNRL